MNIYLVIFIGGFFGMFLHALVECKKIAKRNKEASVTFKSVAGIYFREEWLDMIITAVCFLTLVFVASEWINLKQVENFDPKETIADRAMHLKFGLMVKTISVVFAYCADSIVYGFLGVTEEKIKKQFAEEKAKLDSSK